MTIAACRVALCCLLALSVFDARASACVGPDLSHIAVLADGALEVHGYGGVARSDDQGRSWRDVTGSKASETPFWKREFTGPRGERYQNVLITKEQSIAIVSRDGRAWEHLDGMGPYGLVVWADANSRFLVYGDDLSLDYRGGVGGPHASIIGERPIPEESRYQPFVALELGWREISTKWVQGISTTRQGGLVIESTNQFGPAELGARGRIELGRITGFFVELDTIYVSSQDRIVRGKRFGQAWEELAIPKGWHRCSVGPLPPPTPPRRR